MSNYLIPCRDGVAKNIAVRIGWDPQLQTYFANALEVAPDAERPEAQRNDKSLLFAGGRAGDITEVQNVRELVSPWCDIDDELIDRLEQDRKKSGLPNDVQRSVIDFFEGIMPPRRA